MRETFANGAAMLAVTWRTSRTKMVVGIALTLLGGVSWPLVAVALRAAVDAVVRHDIAGAVTAGVLLGLGTIGALILHHFAFVPYAEAAEQAVVDLESELIEVVGGSARIDHQESAEYADRIAVLQRELAQFNDGMIGLMTTVSLAVSLGVTGVLLARLNPWLLLLPVAALPTVLAGHRAQLIIDRSKDAAAPITRQATHLFRLATGAGPAKELRVFRLPAEVRRRHARLWAAEGRVLWRAERRAAVISALGQAVFAAAYIVAVLLVLRQSVAGRGTVGDLVLVIILAAQINQQVHSGLELLRRLQQISQGMGRLRWLRAQVDDRPVAPEAALPDRLWHGIELRGLGFAYPGTEKPVLSDVNVLLPAGSTVAIVGENGAGKTTLVKLLCRFYEPTTGTVTLDGADLRRLPLDKWRRRVSAGFQDFVRFELPASQTVGVGDLPRMDDETAVRDALQRARAGDVVDRLPDGLRTHLGKSWADGVELSGGQWQKLALGRAMMRERPLLLILDEPTSALDAQAEHRLFERYAAGAKRVGRATGAITVLVSHRFSTVRMADLILVVAEGSIIEAGDHTALMARDGLYAELYSMQAAAYR